jgi:hypothetical protein
MTDQELVDLVAYLTTLKQPVSIIGQYQAVGPIQEANGRPVFEPIAKLDLHGAVNDGRGRELTWRRMSANAEGQIDVSPLISGDSKNAAYVWVPVVSPVAQKSKLVVDTPANIGVWLDGKPVGFSGKGDDKNEPRSAVVDLSEGTSTLLIRLTAGDTSKGPASIVTTLVADRPVGFSAADPGPSAHSAK